MIPNYTLAGWISSRNHGLASFVHERLKWTFADQSLEGSANEWLCVDVDGCKIVNIYKPPNSQLTPTAISVFQQPCLSSGDFNCWNTDWGYDSISPDGECLANWAALDNFVLLHDPKDVPSFFSGRWHTGTNRGLAFASVGHESWSLDICTLEKFLRSQHRPSLITAAKLIISVTSAQYKRWNFRKPNWELYRFFTNKLAKNLPSPDSKCWMRHIRIFATPPSKQQISIPCGRRNNNRPCCDAECESLYQTFFKVSSSEGSNKAASDVLAQIDEKRRPRWLEAVNIIDFTQVPTLGSLTSLSMTLCAL